MVPKYKLHRNSNHMQTNHINEDCRGNVRPQTVQRPSHIRHPIDKFNTDSGCWYCLSFIYILFCVTYLHFSYFIMFSRSICNCQDDNSSDEECNWVNYITPYIYFIIYYFLYTLFISSLLWPFYFVATMAHCILYLYVVLHLLHRFLPHFGYSHNSV